MENNPTGNEREVDLKFKRVMKEILHTNWVDEGPRPRWESDGEPAHSIFLTQYHEKYHTEAGEVPITSLRSIHVNKALEEIFWIYQDQSSDLALLEARGVHWWNNWALEDGTIGERYGKTVKNYDLMNRLLDGLVNNPFGRRHIINLWQETDLAQEAKLPPCAFETIWSVRPSNMKEGKLALDCTLNQRSNDVGPAMHINLMQYHGLQLAVAKHCGYEVGNFVRNTQNIHLYDRHVPAAKEMLARTGQETEPRFYLNVPDKTNFYDIKASDFVLENYHPVKPQLKFELAV